MPVFFFKCPICKAADKRLLTPDQAKQPQRCRKKLDCGGTLERDVRAPAMHHKEVIDNGAMVRKVERFVDGEKLAHERTTTDYRKPD